MRLSLILGAFLLSWVMWGIAALCIAHRAHLEARVAVPSVRIARADAPLCVTIPAPPLLTVPRTPRALQRLHSHFDNGIS